MGGFAVIGRLILAAASLIVLAAIARADGYLDQRAKAKAEPCPICGPKCDCTACKCENGYGGWVDSCKAKAKPTPTTGRLLLHEEYEYNGRRVGLDESTDRPATPEKAVPPTQARTQAERPKYVQHPTTGLWWKQYADGSWEYCTECNVQNAVQTPQAYYLYYPQSSGGFRGRSGGG